MKITEPASHEPILKVNLEDNIEHIFKKHYKLVCFTIYKLIPDASLAEDLAQDVFCDLWTKRSHLRIKTSIKGYLRKSAANKALNHIRKKEVLSDSDDTDVLVNLSTTLRSETLEIKELQEFINSVIDTLPKKCRLVFMLSRFEHYSYKEIAAELEISIKTVENQITRALKVLRRALEAYDNQYKEVASSLKYSPIAC